MLAVRRGRPPPSPPAFNAPRIVVWSLGCLAALHGLRFVLSSKIESEIIVPLIFSPLRYGSLAVPLPGGWGAKVWTFASYALVHADFGHLAINGLWLLVFGSVVARRFGAARFLLFSALCSAAGAALFLAMHWGQETFLIGASAAVSGHMAAGSRFMFSREGPADILQRRWARIHAAPALSLPDFFRNRQAVGFVLIWFAINLVAGLVGFGVEGQIAWEAHLGGFLAGLFFFSLFDRQMS